MVDINQLTIRAKWDHRKTGGKRLTRASSKNCYWQVPQNKVCDLREPSRGPNIELSEARSHQPAWGSKGSHTPKSYWTNLLVIHAYTNTKGFILTTGICQNSFLAYLWEPALTNLWECHHSHIFVRTSISLLVRIAFSWILSRLNIPSQSLLMLVECYLPSRQSRGWLGWRRYFGSSTYELINWYLPINWFRTHTHRILSFLRYTNTRSESAANPKRYLNPLLSRQSSTVAVFGHQWWHGISCAAHDPVSKVADSSVQVRLGSGNCK